MLRVEASGEYRKNPENFYILDSVTLTFKCSYHEDIITISPKLKKKLKISIHFQLEY